MNKYQEALNGIIECYEELESRVGNDPNKVKEFDGIKTLQELVDKTTPKKVCCTYAPHPTIEYDQELEYYYCPTCEEWLDERDLNYYCPICGQKLDWSDE